MSANTKQNDTVTLTREHYQNLLELHLEQSMEIKRIQNTLKSEYQFAEEKIAEINNLKEAVEVMESFIASAKDIQSRYEKFVKDLGNEPANEGNDDK